MKKVKNLFKNYMDTVIEFYAAYFNHIYHV